MITNIAIVVVLYNPTEEQILHIYKNPQQSNNYNFHLIVIDNSSTINITKPQKNLYYISNGKNRGIAYAQNIGIRKAKELKCDYVIFFDQDSEFSDDFIKKMLYEYKQIKRCNDFIATLGPVIIDKNTKIEYKNKIGTNQSYSKVDTIISSGSMIEVSNFDAIGGMEEKLFIDLVDHEWCWRAKSLGYVCYQTSSISMEHKVGSCSKALFGFPIIISSPTRYYYKYRNFLWMLKRSYVPIKWKVKELIRKVVEFICVPIMAKNITIYRYLCKGIKDGIFK
jgi:rhamnosyltransferase